MSQQIQKMLKQAQKMQSQMMKAQEELAQKEVTGTAGGGMVKVVMNGAQDPMSVKIDKQAVDPDDVEMLEDLVLAAVKNAQEQVKEMTNASMGPLTQGMGIPGF